MTIFNTAYDTTACSGMNLVTEKIRNALNVMAAKGYGNYTGVDGVEQIEREMGDAVIPSFSHPVSYHIRGQQQDSLAADFRPFIRKDAKSFDYKITDKTQYVFMQLRLHLNRIWMNPHGIETIRDLSPVSMAMYAAWISENIRSRLGLEPHEQVKLAMYAAYFYATLFLPRDEPIPEARMVRVIATIAKATNASPDQVETFINALPQQLESKGVQSLDNITEWCKALEEVVGSVRLRDFSPGTLVSYIKGTWFGVAAYEVLAVALEHPPTWLAVITMAYVSDAYKKTGITSLAERFERRGGGRQFVDSVKVVLKGIGSKINYDGI